MKYIAANIQGEPKFATEKVSANTARFYNAETGQRIGLIRAGPDCTFCGKEWDIYTYQPVCATQTAATVPDATAPVYKRYSMTRNLFGFTEWTLTHIDCA